MRRTVKIANRALWIQRTANLPNVFTAFNYDYKKPYTIGSDVWGKDWNVTLGASMPLFTGGSNLFKAKQIKAQLKQAKLGLAMLEDGITLDVKSAYFNLEQEKQILSYQSENVQTAEQALNLAEQRYVNGQITNLEYMDIQLALTQARFDQMTSISNCIIAQVKLLNALGK
jgi:outer membrane protein TolC